MQAPGVSVEPEEAKRRLDSAVSSIILRHLALDNNSYLALISAYKYTLMKVSPFVCCDTFAVSEK